MNRPRPYPAGVDAVWLASDARGHLGAFITGGSGPIPTRALAEGAVAVQEIEGRLLRLPKTGTAQLLHEYPRPDSILELAQRGLFVFDWRDVHRVRWEYSGVYEVVAIPMRPTTLGAPPDEAGLSGVRVHLPGAEFSTMPRIDVRDLVECLDGTSS